jgi:hypothetical protein
VSESVAYSRRVAFRDDPSYAWAIALTPLASAASVLLDATLAGWVLTAVTIAAVVLAQIDISTLARKGVGVEVLDGLMAYIPPWYLIRRTRYVGSPAAIPIAWFATFSVAVVALASVA